MLANSDFDCDVTFCKSLLDPGLVKPRPPDAVITHGENLLLLNIVPRFVGRLLVILGVLRRLEHIF